MVFSYSTAKCDNQYSLLTLDVCGFTSLDPLESSFHNTITMIEGKTSSKISPYRFEPVSVSNYSDQDTSSSKSETDIREQASFMEQ